MKTETNGPTFGVLAALGGELGSLGRLSGKSWQVAGARLSECELTEGLRLIVCVSGVGKVRAAAGAAALIAAGASRGLLVVGLGGGLCRGMAPGDVIHCETAVQVDSALTQDREFVADPGLRAAWTAAVPGQTGWFLTADRPVLNPWRRARLARAFRGPCMADMETAAVAAVAHRSLVPWAAMRIVSDLAGFGAARAFAEHFSHMAGRAADTLIDWVPLHAPIPHSRTP